MIICRETTEPKKLKMVVRTVEDEMLLEIMSHASKLAFGQTSAKFSLGSSTKNVLRNACTLNKVSLQVPMSDKR